VEGQHAVTGSQFLIERLEREVGEVRFFVMNKMDDTELLMKCPQCERWPMAVVSGDRSIAPGRISFRCPNCHAHAVYSVDVAGRLVPAADRGFGVSAGCGGCGGVMMRDALLSPREKLLLRRLALGRSDHAIGMEIGGRADQISKQRQRLLDKLNISSPSEIADAAHRLADWPASGR
jgi:DNA-binding CsgD family transcriptional regulator/Zn finger protein HypA/HybF involved in hydrogenase expression